ncbi:MAG: esterase [Nocardiaceae bacterium]|nr:esterase [Nocardiaceae bacterium]
MRRAHRLRSRALVLCAAALVTPFVAQAATSGIAAAMPAHAAPAAGATVKRVTWMTDRRVELEIFSPSANGPVKVQLLLARDWYAKPTAKFPVVYMLDGLRAQDDESGWTKDARAESFFAEKNANIVLPIGGQSSFYSDWQKADQGKHYMWETFLIKELPPILEGQWRSTKARSVQGLSMGGAAAMMLATRNPGFFKEASSFSGFLQTTSMGMPQAIQYAQHDAGGFTTENMWGKPEDPDWAAHDPYVNADKLRGTALYVSSGSGSTGAYDTPTNIPGVSTNTPGMGLEILSRLSSQNFATKLNELAIPAQVVYRPSGTHTWQYWDFEMRQSWPTVANALGIENEKPACKVGGAIANTVKANKWLGDCLTGEYPAGNGVAQDFRFGRVAWSKDTGAQAMGGRIGGLYSATGGTAGPLGLPTGPEKALPNGIGRFQSFKNGVVYWSPITGAASVRGAIKDAYAKQGFERGPLRLPVADEHKTPKKNGAVQPFQGGTILFSPATGAHAVQGKIQDKYASTGWENGPLGFPKSDEAALKNMGRVTLFEGGNIYWSPATGNAWVIKNGPVMNAYKAAGYEKGKLGYPTGDESPIPGGVQQTFQFGVIKIVNGKVTVA